MRGHGGAEGHAAFGKRASSGRHVSQARRAGFGKRADVALHVGAGRHGSVVFRESSGQMAVELAVLIPVIVVCALVVVNVMRYAELCARFDRVAPDAVLAHGVSPSGTTGSLAGVDEVRSAIERGMGPMACEVEVSVEDLMEGVDGALLDLSAGTTRFTCTLVFRPWPSSVSIAGVGYQVPASIRHERKIVVDRYRAAIIT